MSDLIITGIIDGPLFGGEPKAIELYVLNDIADLSIYALESANNGATSAGAEFTLSGSASAGDFLYVSFESTDFNNFLGFNPDFTGGVASINGDDAIILFQNGTIVDVFGEVGVDGTSQPWEYLDGWAYRNANTGPSSSFTLADWAFSGPNALDSETSNATAATPFPIGTFSVAQSNGPVLNETFDDGTQFTTSTPFFSDAGVSSGFDFFGISDGAGGGDFGGDPQPNGIKDYTGFDGSFLTGQDLNGEGASVPVTVTWSGLEISGLSNLEFSGDFAEFFDSPGDIDASDFIRLSYQIDNGGFQDLLWFSGADFSSVNQNGSFNGIFREDTDFDGVGDGTALGNAAETFTAAIAGTGSTLDLQLSISVEAGDEDFGVDNFVIAAGDATATSLSIAAVGADKAEGDSGLTPFTFEITRSGDLSQATSVDVTVSSSEADADDFGGTFPAVSTITFAAGETTKPFTVNGSGDTDAEPDETFTVTLSNASGTATISNGTADGIIQNDDGTPITLISDIQGSGDISPLDDDTVTLEAVVVGDFQTDFGGVNGGVTGSDGSLGGFYVQEEDTDADGNAATSDGIFIFDGFSPSVDVAVGDVVRVTGTVNEFFGETQISSVTNIEVVATGQETLASAATVQFPVASTVTNADGDLIADLEAYEGMLVTIPQELTVADLFTLGRFGDMGLYADGRLETFTQGNAPSVAGFQAYQDLAVRNTVILDDGSTIQNPNQIPFEIAAAPGDQAGQLDANDQLRSGDTITDLTGVVRFSRGSGGSGDAIYRINPTETPTFVNDNPRLSEVPDVGGDLTVAAFNVLNFFTTLDDSQSRNNNPLNAGPANLEPRGANDLTGAPGFVIPSTQAQTDPLAEFNRQVDKLVAALSDIEADVFSLVELENEFGDQNGDGQFSIDFLVDELNAAIPGANYQFVDPGRGFVDTSDAISVGLVYNANKVDIAAGTTVEILDDSDLAGLGLSGLGTVFDGPSTNRAALATTFEEIGTGERFTVAANHFKSKGSPGTAGSGDQDLGDGVGFANQTRLNGAIALNAWLETDPTGSGDSDVLILGDLNAYGMEDPIQYLLNEGYQDQVQRFLEPGTFEYSFGFPVSLGSSPQVQAFGALDYALATDSLASQITGAVEWHINADESVAFDYNLEFRPQAQADGLYDATPFRASDHDPVILGLDLASPVQTEPVFWFSPDQDDTVGAAEDIVQFNDDDSFSIFFDGSDVGLDHVSIDAFDMISDTLILMSFDKAVTLDGVTFDDSDIVPELLTKSVKLPGKEKFLSPLRRLSRMKT